MKIKYNQKNPLPFDLKTNEATIYDIPNELLCNFCGVAITDQHLGRYTKFETDFSIFKNKLETLLDQTKATCLFMLGDTIDYHCRNYENSFKSVFNYLETLQIPIFLLGGNHDKERIEKLYHNFNKNLVYVRETFIRVRHSNSNGEKYSGILMGHDLGNDFQVDPCDAPIYVKWMGDVFRRYFNPGEMMLIGHTHQNIAIKENESYSIKQFSPYFESYQYALIQDDGSKYDVMFLQLNK